MEFLYSYVKSLLLPVPVTTSCVSCVVGSYALPLNIRQIVLTIFVHVRVPVARKYTTSCELLGTVCMCAYNLEVSEIAVLRISIVPYRNLTNVTPQPATKLYSVILDCIQYLFLFLMAQQSLCNECFEIFACSIFLQILLLAVFGIKLF